MLKNPDILLWGLRIQEPITTLTDIFVTLICFYAFFRTRQKLQTGSIRNYLSLYFLLMGLSTLFGGVCGHAFQYILGLNGKLPGWLISTVAILLFELATIKLSQQFLSQKNTKTLTRIAVLGSIASFILILFTKDLKYVQLHATFGMLLISTSLHAALVYKNLNNGSKYILYGIGVSALTALVFNQQIALGKWFNHMDIAHVLMGVSMLLFLKATLNFDKKETLS